MSENTEVDYGTDAVQCTDCGLVRLSRFPEDVDVFFSKSGMRDFIPKNIIEERQVSVSDNRRQFTQIKELIYGKDVIDFGCGCGGFLSFAKDVAHTVTGVEMEDAMRQQLKEEGKIPCEKTIETVGKADVITLFHVLALLENPSDTLMRIKDHLKPNGMIYIETPNFDDILLSVYHCKAFENHAFHRDSLWYFNRKTLVQLAEKCNLKVQYIKNVQRYPLANHLYWLAEGKPGGGIKYSNLVSPALDEEYAKILAKSGKTDTIICVMQNE